MNETNTNRTQHTCSKCTQHMRTSCHNRKQKGERTHSDTSKHTNQQHARGRTEGQGCKPRRQQNLTKTNTRSPAVPAVPPNTCVRLFVENYSNLTAEARRDTIVRFHDLMAAEPVVTVRARCCDLTMLTVSNTRSECTARARK
jgi:hypothetical protein